MGGSGKGGWRTVRGGYFGGGKIEVTEGVGDLSEYTCEFGCKEGWQISIRLQNIADKSVPSIKLWLFCGFVSITSYYY